MDIELEGKILNQRDSFVYLDGAVCGDGKTERDIRRRVQAAANAWRAVARVMAERRFSKRLKGKFMSTCVTLARLYVTETLALTELHSGRFRGGPGGPGPPFGKVKQCKRAPLTENSVWRSRKRKILRYYPPPPTEPHRLL